MDPQKQQLLEAWSMTPVTVSLFQWLKYQRREILPDKILAARRRGDTASVDRYLNTLDALATLEATITSGSFLTETPTNKEITYVR